ncbi:MAG: PAS domain S-box protein [Actinobacteria bacterium]|nr:PAS domain S-box protein [Actinomycetota bacterium]
MAFLVTGLGVSALMVRHVRHRAEAVATFHAQFVTDSVLRPLLTLADLEAPVTGARYDELMALGVDHILSDGRDVRVKIWRSDGTVLFSDYEPIVGRVFPEERRELREVFQGEVLSGVTDLSAHENVGERGLADRLFQTYVPLRLEPDGPIVAAAEVYQDYSVIEADVRGLFRMLAMVFGTGLGILYVALLPIALRASRSLRRQNARLDEQAARLTEQAEELRKSDARKGAILHSALDAVIGMDHEGRITEFNQAAERLFGYAHHDVLGKPLADCIVPSALREQHQRGLDHYLATGESAVIGNRLELTAVRSDGTGFPVELAVALVDLPGPPLFIGVVRDLTERKEAEDKLTASLDMLRKTDAERRHLLAQLVAAQEEERQRIARDIHDDPIQKMTAAALRLGMLRRQLSDPAQMSMLSQVQESVDLTLVRLRSLLFELHPRTLENGGLADALREYLERSDPDSGVTYQLENHLRSEPPTEARRIAYRIAQEALNNVRKHAKAGRAKVVLQDSDGGVLVRIEDDGVGISPRDLNGARPGHLGLSSMRERAEMAGGWLRIQGIPGGGTMVQFWLPGQITRANARDGREATSPPPSHGPGAPAALSPNLRSSSLRQQAVNSQVLGPPA